MRDPRSIDPLEMLDVVQTRAAAIIARIGTDQWDLPTPCDTWSVRDVLNKLVASTKLFTAFGRREQPDPELDLIHPKEILGDDPVGTYLAAATACRSAWRAHGAMDGMAPSTIGEAPSKAVLHARIFDTSILSRDLAVACGLPHGMGDEEATYVLRIARALVPAVRSQSTERYREPVELDEAEAPVDQLIAATGRNPRWTPSA